MYFRNAYPVLTGIIKYKHSELFPARITELLRCESLECNVRLLREICRALKLSECRLIVFHGSVFTLAQARLCCEISVFLRPFFLLKTLKTQISFRHPQKGGSADVRARRYTLSWPVVRTLLNMREKKTRQISLNTRRFIKPTE